MAKAKTKKELHIHARRSIPAAAAAAATQTYGIHTVGYADVRNAREQQNTPKSVRLSLSCFDMSMKCCTSHCSNALSLCAIATLEIVFSLCLAVSRRQCESTSFSNPKHASMWSGTEDRSTILHSTHIRVASSIQYVLHSTLISIANARHELSLSTITCRESYSLYRIIYRAERHRQGSIARVVSI